MNRAIPFSALGVFLLSGCGGPHGQPGGNAEAVAPNQVLEFATLYSENCAACHGENGRGGVAIALADPVYLAVADNRAIRNVVANGVRGTAMPAFAASARRSLSGSARASCSNGAALRVRPNARARAM